jgi:hypothetical protein
MCTVVILFP